MTDLSSRKQQADRSLATGQVFDIKKPRVSGTCAWILEDGLFREWQDESTAEPIIWIHGPMGSGKTSIAEHVYEVLRESTDVPTLCYFCNAKTTPLMILTSILNQLVQTPRISPSSLGVVRDAKKELESQAHTVPLTPDVAWDIFEAAMVNFRGCNLIIDGLDELSTEYLSENSFHVAKQFEHFVKHAPQGWKLYVSSRTSHSSIRNVFQKYPSIQLTAEKTERDMIRFAVREVHRYPNLVSFEAQIVDWVCKTAEGIFIWARLAVQALAREESLSSTIQRLDAFSIPLDDLYTTLITKHLEKQSSIDTRIATIVMAWVLNSTRSITLSELGNAIYTYASIYVRDVAEVVVRTCGPLLKIEAGRVMPMHQSLREHISSTINNAPWIDSIRGSTANQLMSTTCMRYITQLDISDNLFDSLDKDDIRETYPLLEYATLYWVHHLCAALPSTPGLANDAASFFQTKSAFNWASKYLPMFLSDSVLDVPPRRIDAAPIAYLFQLRSQIIGTLSDPDQKSAFEQITSNSLITHYEDALTTSASTDPDSNTSIQHTLNLGEVTGWITGRTQTSQTLLTQAHNQTLTLNLLGSPDPQTRFLALTTQHAQAESLKRAGHYHEAHTLLQEVIDGYALLTLPHPYTTTTPTIPPPPHPSLHAITTNHFFALDTQGWISAQLALYPEAAEHLTRALALSPRLHGPKSPATSRTKTLLASVLISLDRKAEAETLCNEVVAALPPSLWDFGSGRSGGDDNDDGWSTSVERHASTLPLLASVYVTQGDLGKAKEMFGALHKVRARGYGSEHPMTLWAEMQVGLVREKIVTGGTGDGDVGNGDSKEQVISALEGLARRQIAVLGKGHPDVKCCREAAGRLKGEDLEGWEVI